MVIIFIDMGKTVAEHIYQEFCFGHVEFELLVRQPTGAVR